MILEGAWSYTMTTERIGTMPQPGDAQCQVADATLSLSQDRSTFAGTVTGSVSCATIGTPTLVFSDLVSDGSIDGRIVRFLIGTWEHWGVIVDGTMSGSLTMDLLVDGAPVRLAGEWTGTRR
jgi:hypothetical protein